MDIRAQIAGLRIHADYDDSDKMPVSATMHREAADTMEKLLNVYEAAVLVLDEADSAAEQPYESVSPVYIQDILQGLIKQLEIDQT